MVGESSSAGSVRDSNANCFSHPLVGAHTGLPVSASAVAAPPGAGCRRSCVCVLRIRLTPIFSNSPTGKA